MFHEAEHTIIIGGGPAGASAALYLARFCHSVTLFAAPKQVHGRTDMAPGIHNYLTYSKPIKGPDFMAKVSEHLDQYDIERIEEKVVKVEQDRDVYTIITDKQTVRKARYVIVAVGLSDTMPDIEGLDPYYDNGIHHCITCDWYERRDQKLAVVGNTDRSIEAALMIRRMHEPPKLVVIPAAKPDYSPVMLAAAKVKNIEVYTSALKELIGHDGLLEAVKLEDGTQVDIQILFTKLGHKRFDEFLEAGNIHVDREPLEGFINVDWRTFETSVTNLFAVGPCNNGPDQAVIGAGQGALAALEIHRRITDHDEHIK